MTYWQIAAVFAAGVLLAFPLAVLLTVAVGWPLLRVRRIFNPCPMCGARKLKCVNFLRCLHPPSFYLCEACGSRLKWCRQEWTAATDDELRFFNK